MHFLPSSVGKRLLTKLLILLDLTGQICLCEEYSFGVFSFHSNSFYKMLDMCAQITGCYIFVMGLFLYDFGYVCMKGNVDIGLQSIKFVTCII